MLEIFILIRLCKSIGAKARAKGLAAGGYQFMLVLFWFGGELGAAIITAIGLALVHGDKFEDHMWMVYVAGFTGAALAAWTAFLIVGAIAPAHRDEEDDEYDRDDDDYVRGDRKRRTRRDDRYDDPDEDERDRRYARDRDDHDDRDVRYRR